MPHFRFKKITNYESLNFKLKFPFMKNLLLAVLLFNSINSFGQENANLPKFNLSYLPTSLVNWSGLPGFEFEFEHFLKPKLSYFLEFNRVDDILEFYTFQDDIDFFKGYAIGIGARGYNNWKLDEFTFPIKHSTISAFYIDFGYKIAKTNRGVTSTFMKVDSSTYQDNYTVNRTEHVLFSDFGVKIFLKRLSFDTKIGLGYKWRNVKHSNRVFPNDPFYMPYAEYFIFDYEEVKLYKLPALRAKFSIGYLLIQ